MMYLLLLLTFDEVSEVKGIRDRQFPNGVLEYVLYDGTRVDLLLKHHAVEADWAHKWAEGVGQALYYARVTGKKPVVLLLLVNSEEEKFIGRVHACGLECWAYNTVARKWIQAPDPRGEY